MIRSDPDGQDDDHEWERLCRAASPSDDALEREFLAAIAQMNRKYVVVVRSEFTTQITGPYVDAFAALCAAEMELRFNENRPEDEQIRIAVAPLKPYAA